MGRGRAAVLGRPVDHSLSPVLHRAAYAELGLDWTYTAIECGADDLADVLDERRDWAGFSCTMPLKHAAIEIAAHVRPVARAVGAANTLLPGPDGWIADNTDVAGIASALAEHGLAPERATILGAGGTAAAAVAALAAMGVRHVDVLVRDPARASALCEIAAGIGLAVQVTHLDVADPALAAALVVSTLPPGAADSVAGRSWRSGQAVLDVVYSPWPTALAAAARHGGATVVSGALMLLHQASAQVSLMTGLDAPVPAMRHALASAVPGCGV